MRRMLRFSLGLSCIVSLTNFVLAADVPIRAFLEKHCLECHSGKDAEASLDLAKLPLGASDAHGFSRWVKVHDRIRSGEMPPKDSDRPAASDVAAATSELAKALIDAEKARDSGGRTAIRRLTRSEYENTMRDLFSFDGLSLQGDLPPDGTAHGFDKNIDALDISHVNLAKYYETADRVLDMAIATQPTAPKAVKQRVSLATPASGVAHVIMHGDALMLKDKKADPEFPPAGLYHHIDQGAHQQMGMFDRPTAVGTFRHEDESFSPYFLEFAALYPGRYKIQISLWSFFWEKGTLLPSSRIEPVRLSAVQLARRRPPHRPPKLPARLSRRAVDRFEGARGERVAQLQRHDRLQSVGADSRPADAAQQPPAQLTAAPAWRAIGLKSKARSTTSGRRAGTSNSSAICRWPSSRRKNIPMFARRAQAAAARNVARQKSARCGEQHLDGAQRATAHRRRSPAREIFAARLPPPRDR